LTRPLGDGRRFHRFQEFLEGFVKELNDLSTEGGAVLVEGKRDVAALRAIGYSGPIFSVSILKASVAARQKLREDVLQMVVLTDLDAEGRRLASRFMGFLALEGVRPSLAQRRRLSAASRGIFLHIENLSRFAPEGHRLAASLADDEPMGLNKGRGTTGPVKRSNIN
jgi:5S rRNA maturation endonuclease (ribonuclease M5)